MLNGTADIDSLATGAPALRAFDTEPVRLEDVQTFQIFCEIGRAGAEALLPRGLHPTLPPVVTWLIQLVGDSPWGAFGLAQCRVECRSGLRPRGFLRAGVIDNEKAATELAARWGYRLRQGRVALQRGYDHSRASVTVAGDLVLDLMLRDPQPLRPADAYFVANMNLARTPRGLRLVQVDPDFEVERVERGDPNVLAFDSAAWDSEGVRPSHPVSALLATGSMTLPALRYVCKPNILAYQGSERVDA